VTKSISQWQEEITAWGASKGWDKPALCEMRGMPVQEHSVLDRADGTRSVKDFETYVEPQGVDTNAVLAKIALCHSELSEALEAARDGKYIAYEKDGKPEGVVVELADTMIRIMHLAGLLGLDLEDAVEQKMAANQKRPYRHGGRLA